MEDPAFEFKKRARCNQAHGLINAAIRLLLEVHKGDQMYEGHKAPLEKAISDLLTAKHLLARQAGFSEYRGK